MAVKCEDLQNRMAAVHRPVNCLDIEKVAYVLGKEKVDLDEEREDTREDDDEDDEDDEEGEEDQVHEIKNKTKRKDKSQRSVTPVGSKRKADAQESSEPTTKRTRGKKSG